MLYRIFGPAGSGKSRYITDRIAESVKSGHTCYYIVPEQQSVAAERNIAHVLGDRGALMCEVLNFERLPNRVGRQAGGIAVSYIDKGGRDLLLSLVLIKAHNELTEYAPCCSDPNFVRGCAKMISRFKADGVDSKRLFEICESKNISDNRLLHRKIHDMAVIMREYEARTDGDLRDPIDALSALSKQLDTYMFFKGSDVFIDGYYTFTGQEYEIIRRLCIQCRNVYITFIDDGRELFADNRAAASRIASFCREYKDIAVGAFKRSQSPDIKHIESSVWGKDLARVAPMGDVHVITAANMFEECEAISAYILKSVSKGARYREISIISANAAEYNDILESVFAEHGIPCFSSRKEAVVSKPLFAFVLSVLQMAAEDFSLQSVRRCLKSGFSPLSPEQCDFLLRYAEMWNLRGSAWYSENEWMMNPDGFDAVTESSERLRIFINNARHKLVHSVLPVRDRLCARGLTVGEAARIIYRFMQDNDVESKVNARAELLQKAGDADGAMRETQVYDCMIDLLDQLCLVADNDVIALSKLSELIEIMSSEYSVGSIPSSADAVTVGAPELFRADGCGIAIICGLTDGAFTAYGNDGFFDDDELVTLEGEGINAFVPREENIRRQRFLFYIACTSASQKLLLTCSLGEISGEKKRMSLGLMHIMSLFDGLKPYMFGSDISDRVFSVASASDIYIALDECAAKSRLADAIVSAGAALPGDLKPIFDPVANIEFDKPKEFGLSPSALERYVYCPFSYFASRLMKLKKTERLRFAAAQTGTLIHKALEEYMRKCTQNGAFIPLEKHERDAEIDNIVAEFFRSNADGERYAALTKGIKRTLNAVFDDIANEFAVCDFLPVGFEVRLGNGRDGSKKAMSVDIDGSSVYVRGVADRVDMTVVDGVRYIRITDYKTGQKSFSMSLIDEGLDMQMPMYLFSLCDVSNAEPAGCMYYTATLRYG